ncbi:PREDICTED: uncharacterized protein LOC107358081 [Acropora digitifera]|uniref:uncharacterized protein LOC107358081 n=1 Tax=Acropora digitifera TaxID=70779 RepID=UPI00077A7E32|nr:PREDICTED: uncharacterized protein LOC107358081 [Acropora digitifera]
MGRTFLLTAVIVVNAIVLPRSFVAGLANSSQIMENGDIAHFVCHASNVTDLIKWEKDGKEVEDGKEGVAIVTCNSSSHLLVAVANNRRGRYSCTITSEVKQSFELEAKEEGKLSVVDKVAIGVSISLSFILFSLLLFFLLRGKRRLRENLVKKNSTVSVNAEVNSFSKITRRQ